WDQLCVSRRDDVVVESEGHHAEARMMRNVPGLHAIEHEFPARAVLSGEFRNPVDRIAARALVPRGERERAGGRRDVIRVRAILDLRLEPLALSAERLENRGCAVGEWKRSR